MIFIQVFMANMGATVFVVLMIVVTLMITWNSVLSKIIDFIGKHIIEPLIDIIGNMIRDIIPSDERLKENITLMGHSDEDHSIDVYKYNYIHDAKENLCWNPCSEFTIYSVSRLSIK